MRKLKNAIFGGALAGILTITQLLTPVAYAEGGTVSGAGVSEEEKTVIPEEGTYVPGEAVICVRESAPDDELIVSGAYGSVFNRIFNRVPDVRSKELMDVSRAAALIEKEGRTGDPDPDILDDAGEAPGTTVIKVVHSDRLSTEELIDMYSGQPGVVFAEPNRIFTVNDIDSGSLSHSDGIAPVSLSAEKPVLKDTPYPSLTDSQYGFMDGPGGMDVPGWNSKTPNADKDKYDREIVVAVLDTGVDYENPDLKNVMWDKGLDYPELEILGGGRCGYNSAYEYYIGDNPTDMDDPMDFNGHGTHLAGIIASEWNDFGTSGIAGGAKIMAIKQVYDDAGHSNMATSIMGFNYILQAREAGVNVTAVNCSFGGREETLAIAYAARELGKLGTVVCFASGNDADDNDIVGDTSAIQLSLPSVLTVNSNTNLGESSGFSNYGIRTTHLFAPGSTITSTYPMAMSRQYPDESKSKAVTVSDNVLLSDGFESFEKSPFIYTANPYNGTALEMKERGLDITDADLASNDDPVTKETLGNVDTGSTVAFTAVSRYDLDEPAGDNGYSLILGARSMSGRKAYFPKVYVKTVSGNWERPNYTINLDEELSYNVYPLNVSLNGNPFKLDPLEFRVVLCDTQYDTTGPGDTSVIIEKMWVTDAEKIPYCIDSGTSMAAPAVAGEVAVLSKAFPDDSAEKRAARVIAGARPVSEFKDKCITGGIANVRNSLDEDMYTPVLTSVRTEPGRIHVDGYFFGDAEDLSLSIEQGSFTWNTDGDGIRLESFKVTHDTEDPDLGDISFAIPYGIRGGDEVRVEIHDKSKKYHEERGSFRRIMTLMDPGGYTESLYYPVPVNVPDEIGFDMYRSQIFNAQALKGRIYYVCADFSEYVFRTFAYDPVRNSWTRPNRNIGTIDCTTAWNGMILYFSDSNPRRLTYYDGNDIVKQTDMVIEYDKSVPEDDIWVLSGNISANDKCDVYYDGRNFLLFRTDDNIGVTAVYDVDPFAGIGRYIGKMKFSYTRGVTITHEETPDGNVIYIMGFDKYDEESGFFMEKFSVNKPGLIDSEILFAGGNPFSADGNAKDGIYNGFNIWKGCGLKNGIIMSGPTLVSDAMGASSLSGASSGPLKPSGYLPDEKHVASDNFFLSFDHPEKGFVPMSRKIAEPSVYYAVPAALDGKVYFYGFTKDGFVMSYKHETETYEHYGEMIIPGSDPRNDTDRSVKVKKLSFIPAKVTLEAGNVPNTIPVSAVFADPSVTADIFFESSNPEILRVNPGVKDKGCVVWPVRQGTATVTAYCGNKTAKCTVTTEGRFRKDPDTLSLNKANVSLKTGETDVLILRSLKGEQPYLTGREKIKWRSGDTKVAAVKNGVVTAKKAGETEITATWSLGRDVRIYSCKVSVTDNVLPKENKNGDRDVKLSLSSNKLKANAGDPFLVTAKLKGSGSADRKVKFTSSNPDILTIGPDGADALFAKPVANGNGAEVNMPVIPVAPGTAYVIVESAPEGAGESGTNRVLCKVTVSAPLKKIGIVFDTWNYIIDSDQECPVLVMKPGEVTSISYFADPDKCTDLANVKWSARGGTATVKCGVVTAKKVKLDKEGKPVPTVVTLKIGKAKKDFLVVVR